MNPPRPEETAERLLPAEEDPGAGVAPSVDALPESEPTPGELGLELPEDEGEARRLLLAELAEARREADEYLESLRRVAAEFDNYRKRIERDQIDNVRRASQRLIEAILPALDSFDAALGYRPAGPGEERLLEGMRSTYAQLMEILSREGLTPIEAKGERFDPALHDAVSAPGEGDGDLVVVEELRRGYTLHGRVIRPSLVRVDHADHA